MSSESTAPRLPHVDMTGMAHLDDNNLNRTPAREVDTDTVTDTSEGSMCSVKTTPRKPFPARLFAWVDSVRDAKLPSQRQHEPRHPATVDDDTNIADTSDREKSSIATTSTQTSTQGSTSTEETTNGSPPSPSPYHVFERRKKWQLVLIVSLAGLFSPLSSNIYFPALGAIAEETKTSIALISLTVTIYMVVQGLAPSFWGPLSDTRGRRVTFIGTLSVYLLANVGLAFSKDFASLMAFRAIQAAGSAATISVGAGVIGDITTASERGGFMGSFGGIRMLGQSIGPVIGGIITEYFGFHAIFWFLFLLGSCALFLILLFLPETLRRIAGDGTTPLYGLDRPIVARSLEKRYWQQEKNSEISPAPKITLGSILSPLRFLFGKDVFVTLFFGAIVYTIWSMVTSSTTALFQPRFGLSNLQVGLIFLPNGAGCVLGSYLMGKILDRDYAIVETAYRKTHSLSLGDSIPLDRKRLADFPVSRARLRSAVYLVSIFVVAVAGYGFSITSSVLLSHGKGTGLAIPLVLQFIIAFTATGVFTQNSALVVDLYPGASASATAVNNLVRCSVGAVGVAVVQFVVDAIGAGWTFLMFALLAAACSPLLVLQWVYGERWRRERMERMVRKEGDV